MDGVGIRDMGRGSIGKQLTSGGFVNITENNTFHLF
jgi:hypothetical protein